MPRRSHDSANRITGSKPAYDTRAGSSNDARTPPALCSNLTREVPSRTGRSESEELRSFQFRVRHRVRHAALTPISSVDQAISRRSCSTPPWTPPDGRCRRSLTCCCPLQLSPPGKSGDPETSLRVPPGGGQFRHHCGGTRTVTGLRRTVLSSANELGPNANESGPGAVVGRLRCHCPGQGANQIPSSCRLRRL
jgi:hypothetical protein